ncbi:hypothetical protein SO802_013436 [Lithocarpus litseifolius]|uniref:SHSP domain-containing protein n=1 Tax=Lithocarpus litseifolius TaxID=425828 RepID=A0AAW2D9I9_9ROSI
MASSIRGGRSRSDNIEPDPLNPRQTVLHVAPLNSVPYIGPPTPHSYTASSPAKKNKDFSCEVEPDGKIVIKGVTTTGEKIVCKNSQIFQMQSQNLCPPGHFSISFQLPGPVDNQQFSGSFGIDGILEGIVKKR